MLREVGERKNTKSEEFFKEYVNLKEQMARELSRSTREALENHQQQVAEQVGRCPGCATWMSRLAQDQ